MSFIPIFTTLRSNTFEMDDKVDDSANLDELNERERNKHIGGIVFVSVLMVIGVVGNSHVLLVYSIKMKHTPRRIFTLVLGMLDFIASAVGMPFIVLDLSNPLMFDNPVGCKILRFVNYFVSISSTFVLLIVAIDRYRKVCLPLSKQITKTKAKLFSLFILLFSCGISWPAAVMNGSTKRETTNPNVTGISCAIIDTYENSLFPSIYNLVLLLIVCVTSVCLVVFYCLIGKTISRFKKHVIPIKQRNGKRSTEKLQKHFGAKVLDSPSDNSKDSEKYDKKEHYEVASYMSNIPNVVTFHSFNHQNIITAPNDLSIEGSIFVAELYCAEESHKGTQNIRNEYRNKQDLECRSFEESQKETKTFGNVIKEENNRDTVSEIEHNQIHEEISSVIPTPVNRHETTGHNTSKETGKHVLSAARTRTKAKRTTFMFCLITIVFIISYSPHLILKVVSFNVPGFMDSISVTGLRVYNTLIWCFYINNVANSILYLIFDREFRHKVVAFYQRICCQYLNRIR